MRYGPVERRRLPRCSTCKTRFSERKGAPLFDADSPPSRRTPSPLTWSKGSIPARPADSRASTPRPSLSPPRRTKSSSMRRGRSSGGERSTTNPTTRRDCWDRTAIDPESRTVVSAVVGKRAGGSAAAVVRDVRRRTGGRVMRPITSDEYPAYLEAIRAAYGQGMVPPPHRPTGPTGPAPSPGRHWPSPSYPGCKRTKSFTSKQTGSAGIGTIGGVKSVTSAARCSGASAASWVSKCTRSMGGFHPINVWVVKVSWAVGSALSENVGNCRGFVASPLALGARGRRFKSGHPDSL